MQTALFNGYKVNLIETEEELDNLVIYSETGVGVDTETSGLVYEKDVITGICLSTGPSYSTEDYQGYYLPVRHNNWKNLPIDKVLFLMQKILDNYTTWFFNRNFDVQMLEQEGITIPLPSLKGGTNDAQILVYLTNQEPRPALKDSAARYLNWEVLKLASQFEESNIDVPNADPTKFYIYAAGDAILTVFLAKYLWEKYPFIRRIYATVDNYSGEAIRFLCNRLLYLDTDKAKEMCEMQEAKIREIEQTIFDFVGVRFNMRSTQQRVEVLSRYCTLQKKTKKGTTFSTDDTVLSDIVHALPNTPAAFLAGKMLEYATLNKEITSYLRKMSNFPKNGFHVNYNGCLTVTGRLSSGGGSSYFANLNIQNIPKVEIKMYVHPDERFGLIANLDPENALGKVKNKAGMRTLFIAPEGWSWMSYDYSSMELRIAALYANERTWINAIKEGKDIHMETARAIFHMTDDASRTKIKAINFGVLYGMGLTLLAKNMGATYNEAKNIYNSWLAALPGISRWMQKVEFDAKRTGYVSTLFGRPRFLKKYFDSQDPGLRDFGRRCAINTPVQGLGGDICRVDLFKVMMESRTNKDFRENCLLCNTVHDELNFYVRDAYRYEADRIIRKIMTVQLPGWEVPLDVEGSIGPSWGSMVPFTHEMMDPDGRLKDFIK
jgi:DNA polymerase-1